MQWQVHHNQLRVSGVGYLRPGDEVMADRGVIIQDPLFERKVKLVLPAFTRRGLPLSEEDTTNTRRIANVRVHVERVIRRLKNSRIVSQTVPISLAQKFDKILCESVQVYVIFVGTLYKKMRNKMFNQL